MSTLLFYHFSDLHFRVKDEFDRKVVLNALWSDVRDQMKFGHVPDFVAVTGDIAFSGQVDEYKRAEEEFFIPLLDITNLQRCDLFIIPGNHDVDLSILKDLNASRISSLQDRDQVNDFISQSRTLARYLAPFEAYHSFVSKLCGLNDSINISYCRFVDRKVPRVAIIGLNTAWTSGYDLPQRNPTEQGGLIVGERQILDAP